MEVERNGQLSLQEFGAGSSAAVSGAAGAASCHSGPQADKEESAPCPPPRPPQAGTTLPAALGSLQGRKMVRAGLEPEKEPAAAVL